MEDSFYIPRSRDGSNVATEIGVEGKRCERLSRLWTDAAVVEWLGSNSRAQWHESGEVIYVNLDVDNFTCGRMAGINQGFKTIGEMAVELLVGKLLRNDFGLPKVASVTLVKGDWIDGATVKARD